MPSPNTLSPNTLSPNTLSPNLQHPLQVRVRSLICLVAALCFGSAVFTGTALAQNGTVDFTTPLCGNTPQSAGVDLAYDTFTNDVWALDQGSGQVCRYSLSAFPPDILFSQSVNHPYGPSTPPFFTPLMSGLTYNPVAQTLLLMNGTTLELSQLDSLGQEILPRVTLAPPVNSSLVGLAYDTVTGNIWSRDTVNNLGVELDLVTGTVVSTVNLPGESTMYGSGISFTNSGGVRTLEFTRGGTLDFRPASLVRIDAVTGAELCVEVDLTQVPDRVLGVVRPPTGTVIYATTVTGIYKIDATQSPLTPPSSLACFNNIDGTVSLSWSNCGNGAGGLYSSIRILRDGAVIDILAGNITSFTDSAPSPLGGSINYQVVGVEGATTAPSSCLVQTGSGGLISYQDFDGQRPYDIALDPDLGELYVTDNFSDLVYVYDTNLSLLRILATGISNLQGITYNTSLDLLYVSNSGSSLLRAVDPFTGGSVPGQSTLPLASGGNAVAMTYDVLNDDYLYIDANASPVEIVRIDADPLTPGNFIESFTPPGVTGLLLGGGICHLSATDTFILPMKDSTSGGALTSVSELFSNGFPTGFAFPTSSMGGSVTTPNAIRGVEDLANVLFVANSATNSIFRILIASGGATFIRGEVNGDATIDLADVISIADYLFQSGPTPSCLDAADVNDSGSIDISDPLYLLLNLFTGGPPPPAPYPAAGPDPTFLDPFGC